MKISGRWNTDESYKFHVEDKNAIRAIIDGDPDCEGVGLEKLAEIKTDPKILMDHGEGITLNYAFFEKMREEFNRITKKHKLSFLHRRIQDSFWDKLMSVFKQDSAYFERIGGVVECLFGIFQQLEDIGVKIEPNGTYEYIFKSTRDWWDENDQRQRYKHHYRYMFNYFIKTYESDDKFRYVVNVMLIWMNANRRNWIYHERFDPSNWYGCGKRGAIDYMVHGRQS